MCRLVEQKAIDRLIVVHSKLIKQGYKHKIFIIGDGPEKEILQSIIQKKQVADTFVLMGKKENPYPYIKEADYFCLLSYFEGYGMVLEEAKILNKNVIITNTAAREAIEGYSRGIILDNNEKSIYNGLEKVLQCKEKDFPVNNLKYDNKDAIQNIKQLLEK